MRAQINDRDFEQLSAYMDGQLAPADQRRLEERLRARPDLQEALEDLRRTRALLRAAPRRRAPRNFTLTPAMVGEQAGRRRGGFFNNMFPALSFASAIATLALVASLLFELVPGVSPSTTAVMEAPAAQETARLTQKSEPQNQADAGPAAGAAPAAPSIAGAEPAAESAGQDASAPPVIVWGSTDGYGMGGGGAPDTAWGRGGGGGLGGGGAGPYGLDGSVGNGQIVVPQEGISTLNDTSAAPPAAVQPDPSITGTGPILGVAPTEQTGQIVEREVMNQGLPVDQQAVPAAEEQPAPAPMPESDADRSVLGLPPLRLAQVLLAVLAVITGLAAVILRRR